MLHDEFESLEVVLRQSGDLQIRFGSVDTLFSIELGSFEWCLGEMHNYLARFDGRNDPSKLSIVHPHWLTGSNAVKNSGIVTPILAGLTSSPFSLNSAGRPGCSCRVSTSWSPAFNGIDSGWAAK